MSDMCNFVDLMKDAYDDGRASADCFAIDVINQIIVNSPIEDSFSAIPYFYRVSSDEVRAETLRYLARIEADSYIVSPPLHFGKLSPEQSKELIRKRAVLYKHFHAIFAAQSKNESKMAN